MLRKIKVEWREFVSARKRIKFLETYIEDLQESNHAWVVTANKSLQNYVELKLSIDSKQKT